METSDWSLFLIIITYIKIKKFNKINVLINNFCSVNKISYEYGDINSM